MKTTQKQTLFQTLSLDVVLGSIAVGLFATKLLDVKPNPYWWLVLPIVVWVVYTLDHLIDGFKRKGESNIYRHKFHFQNRKILVGLMTVLGISAIALSVLFLNKKIILGGVFLGLIVMLYQGLNFASKKSSHFFFQKELFIAVIYVCGIFLAPFVWYGQPITGEKLSIGLVLIALAFAEGVIISYYDYDKDKKDGLSSFTTNFGRPKTRSLMIYFLIGILLFVLYCLWFFDKGHLPFLLILMMMDSILLLLIWKPGLFENNHFFRWIGELVFYLPVCIVFF